MSKKALIAMSGGVDSSVAAYLMQQKGYECIGATMKLYDKDDIGIDEEKACTSLSDIEDARSVAAKLGMPYHVFDFKDNFKEKVIMPFIECYRCGMTPNPCVECNRNLKFAHLLKQADALGCDMIVTGHYARIIKDEEGYHMLKGADESKDQSYVLYSITREMLPKICFPLGGYSKAEIREIAQKHGFINAHKRDSQDICFIPDGDYRRFIEETTGKAVGPGNFVDKDGNVMGEHKGYYSYTIGQRRGLGVSGPSRYFVTEIIPEENKVVLGSNDDLFHHDLVAGDFNWIEDVKEGDVVKARVRYHQTEKEAIVHFRENNDVELHFLEPQRAITKGQAVVLYKGEYVVGGGTIKDVIKGS